MTSPKAVRVPEMSPGLVEEEEEEEKDEKKVTGSSQTKVTSEVQPKQQQQEQQTIMGKDDEILFEIHTYNFTLLLCGLLCGIALGYIVWVFVEKVMIIWIGAGAGLIVARILELIFFPQSVVTIWAPKNSIEMTDLPKWRDTIQMECDFYVQSDMYDFEKKYVRTTAVYRRTNTNAITVHERFVARRNGFKGKLFMDSPLGTLMSTLISAAISAFEYLQDYTAEDISIFLVATVVLLSVIVLVGCLVEVELRKKRFISINLANDYVTNIPLHTIGKLNRVTYAGDFWRLFYIPPEARSTWNRAKLGLQLLFGPVMAAFNFCVWMVRLSIFNGASALFLVVTVATILVYQVHVRKEAKYLEPAMAVLWLAVLVNIFELWYCWSANGRVDSLTILGTHPIRKLELDSDTRIPKEKVRKIFWAFLVSLGLIVIASILVTAVTDNVLRDIVIYNFDSSWKNNYKENEKYISCKADEDEAGRRLSSLLDQDTLRTDTKAKYSSDYDALCVDRNYYGLSAAVAFCSLDWVLLIFIAVYWHINDKYQYDTLYDNSELVWHEITRFSIHFVPSKITWLGRILGRNVEKTLRFYIHPHDAETLSQFLINNVPWYSQLDSRVPSAKELLPRYLDVDMY